MTLLGNTPLLIPLSAAKAIQVRATAIVANAANPLEQLAFRRACGLSFYPIGSAIVTAKRYTHL